MAEWPRRWPEDRTSTHRVVASGRSQGVAVEVPRHAGQQLVQGGLPDGTVPMEVEMCLGQRDRYPLMP
jgi:hypothetical protein